MPSLPIVSGKEAARALISAGFELVPRRGKGSHMVLVKSGHRAIITIPDHRELGRGTLRSIIRAADLTVDEFNALLKK